MQNDKIVIKGANVHNLKNVDIDIPKNKLVVITGLSGSGKSSLAFDTIYAEGQRRYVESLSGYARQFIDTGNKADVEKIQGLTPAIAIDQRPQSKNPRSTVGTMTEIYDLLRSLYASFGKVVCPDCNTEVHKSSLTKVVEEVYEIAQKSEVLVFAPILSDKKGDHKKVIEQLSKSFYEQVRVDGYICTIQDALQMNLSAQKKHTIEVLIDRLQLGNGTVKIIDLSEISKSVTRRDKESFYSLIEVALEIGDGKINIFDLKSQNDYSFFTSLICRSCYRVFPETLPRLFSFNSPYGACESCAGLGTKLEVDRELVIPNKKLTLAEGAIRPYARLVGGGKGFQCKKLQSLGEKYDFTLDLPLKNFSGKQIDILFEGDDDSYEGIKKDILRRYNETNSNYLKEELENYLRVSECSSCDGKRLRSEAMMVYVGGKNIAELSQMNLYDLIGFFENIDMEVSDHKVVDLGISEIVTKLKVLCEVGLDYLTLSRASNTLSGGEAQKIRLATQVSANLSGVTYVLDEPSIGLHQRDTVKLIKTLKKLRDLGNSVIVVEHDSDIIKSADWVVDVGPGAGKHGGEIVAEGTLSDLKKNKNSITGKYLFGKNKLEDKGRKIRKSNKKKIQILGAKAFNLKNIDVEIPLGKFVCVTGVSGSGKSTLVSDILSKYLAKYFYKAKDMPAEHRDFRGVENINKVVTIDQSPIGRTPRSNPATYTGVFSLIRDLYAGLPEAKIKGFTAGHFSFNVKGGRCEECQGDGVKKIEMHFLPDMYVECESCSGTRYSREAREIFWRGKNISDVLSMTVEEAMDFFVDEKSIRDKLRILSDVGLGYINLGQSATTLSGGEAQRIKLATELSRRATGRTFYILDEPTIGLHFEDVKKLLMVLNKLVDVGNTVLVVEHNIDVIKTSDHIIDLGPEGGDKGGYIVAEGTPSQIIRSKKSYTGRFLAEAMKQ